MSVIKKEELISNFDEKYVKNNPWGCGWFKIKRRNHNGPYAPPGQGETYIFRSGECEGFLRVSWVKSCLEDDTCQVFPRVGDLGNKPHYADEVQSKEGEIYRKYYLGYTEEEARREKELQDLEEENLRKQQGNILKEILELEKKIEKEKKKTGRPRGRPKKKDINEW